MDVHDRADVLAEILRERLPSVQRVIEEWSVSGAEAVSYAQVKDLIWQLAAPLGLSLLGFSATEQALRQSPSDTDIMAERELFARAGDDAGRALEQFLTAADKIRP